MMRYTLLGCLMISVTSWAESAATPLQDCRSITEDAARLACYDGVVDAGQALESLTLAKQGYDEPISLNRFGMPSDPNYRCDNSTQRCASAYGQESEADPLFGRLTSNEPNYFAFVPDDSEDHRIQFNLSLKYPLWDGAAISPDSDSSTFAANSRLFFIYNGTYDFYMGSRDSSPVISRRQNPGLAYQYNWREQSGSKDFAVDALRVGWFHESNGMTIDSKREFEARGRNAQDYVSRGWDYLGITGFASNASDSGDSSWAHELELRAYCDCQAFGLVASREDKIFWEDLEEQPKINDYDGLRYRLEYQWSRWLTRFEAKTGTRDADALSNLTGRITLSHMGNIPFSIFYFSGYGRELTTYHERLDYVGVGIELR